MKHNDAKSNLCRVSETALRQIEATMVLPRELVPSTELNAVMGCTAVVHEAAMNCAGVVRSLGGAAELIALLLVVVSVWNTRRALGLPGVVQRGGRWVHWALARLKRRPVTQPVRSSTSLRWSTETLPWEAMGYEERVDKLWDLYQRLSERTRREIDHEQTERARADRQLEERIGALFGGDLRWQRWGAGLLLVGIVLSTWPEALCMVS